MRRAFLLPLAALLWSGCAGYQLGPVKPTMLAKVESIAVPNFRNDTLEPRVEALLANAVIKQIQQDGTYRVARENEADAILEGKLVSITRRPSRSVRGNVLQTREFTLEVRCDYRVLQRATGVVLETRSVTGETNFFVSGSDTIASDITQDERQALPLAAETLAVRLVSQISEGW